MTDIVLPKFFHLRELFNVVATNGVFHLGASPRSLPDPFQNSKERETHPSPRPIRLEQARCITSTCRCCRLFAPTASTSSPASTASKCVFSPIHTQTDRLTDEKPRARTGHARAPDRPLDHRQRPPLPHLLSRPVPPPPRLLLAGIAFTLPRDGTEPRRKDVHARVRARESGTRGPAPV